MAEKAAFATGFDDVFVTCGVGDEEAECLAEGEVDGACERGVDEGDADVEGGGSIEMVGDGDSGSAAPTGTVGIDGRTTVGPAASAVDGPTARTATQTTSATRIVSAARKTRRAGLTGVGECLETGKDRPFRKSCEGKRRLPNHCIPLIRRPIDRLISFWASRAARSCLLSYVFLPLARPSSTFAYPLLK